MKLLSVNREDECRKLKVLTLLHHLICSLLFNPVKDDYSADSEVMKKR